MNKFYFDHNATTPIRPEVLDSMMPFLTDSCGNPSSVHSWGRTAKTAIENGRKTVATLIGAEPEEIYFTGCGTESDNIAVLGSLRKASPSKIGVVTSKIEHSAVLRTARRAAGQGFTAAFTDVDQECILDMDCLGKLVDESTAIVSIMHANNETGVLQIIAEAADVAHKSGALFHTDAVQSAGKIRLNVRALNVDMLAMSAHKFNGPKGVGALYIRKGVELEPIMYGGSHEHGMRPGTQNTAGIVGLAAALQIAHEEMDAKTDYLTNLRDMLEGGIEKKIPDIIFNGRGAPRIPNTVNVSFPGVDGEALLFSLDQEGIAVSTGSACSAGGVDPSHVLVAMGRTPKIAQGSLRISMGYGTTEEGIERLLEVLPPLVERLRRISEGL